LKSARVHKRLLFLVNDAGFFVSHRLPLALGARDCGFEVHVGTAPGDASAIIESHGIAHHPLPLSRSGTNLLGELRVFIEIVRVIRRLKPDIVHLVTVKPVVYGGIAARLLNVPGVVAAISGLGHVFITNDVRTRFLRKFVKAAYRIALRRPHLKVIFQNDSDRAALVQMGAVSQESSVIVRGSGVDLGKYRCTREPGGVPVVTFAARLLRQKGVFEFVAAAALLRAQGVQARYQLVGDTDPGNVSSVTAEELERWKREGVVEVLGYRSDIAEVFAASNLIVLPSYREGLPKVLVEAAACGRAVVTTDTPGCRDAVDPGKTGVLVPPRDTESLAKAICSLLTDPMRRQQMGTAGRALAEREYAIEHIVATHLEIYRAFDP
jgi:glycosyltransferase involved in cell wall biosynthesis